MNHSAKAYSVLICLMCAVATSALAQQPPDLVKSDSLANTAMGTNALLHVNLDESGCHNTASGEDALYSDTSGSYNTAAGFSSLYSNTTGSNNVAIGFQSLYFNTSGNGNTANGYQALYTNTTGTFNTAAGTGALYANSTADYNTASGYGALYYNNGGSNTASGYQALYANAGGSDNTASGVHALASNTTGSNNIAVGWHAGYNLTTGSNNVDLANVGVAAESGVIRIGTPGTQIKAYIAGIYATSVSGSAVVVNSSGQLGVVVSSERFKTDIAPMGSESTKLQALRPVKFHLKTDPNGEVQYGLIAEEVAKVYPELVIRDETGRIDGVRYDELAPMLLNEMQEQQNVVAVQSARIAAQDQHAASQDAKIEQLQAQLSGIQGALVKLHSTDQLAAQR
jgi:Chaperone of endosialidase